jgi:hypothetical protein
MPHKTSYVSNTLQPGERVLAVGRLHWIIYTGAVTAFVFSVGCLLVAHQTSEGTVALVGWVFGLILLAASVLFAAKAWFN